MAEDLASIKVKVGLVIQDVSSFIGTGANTEMESAIREGIERYSTDAPREIVDDIAGDGSTYDLTLPATYVDGFSRIVRIEYPAGARGATYVDGNEWTIYRTASTTALRLLTTTPGTGETTRVTFTSPHTLKDLDSATVTTIPLLHTHAFVNLCGAQCLFRMAARFIHEQESTLNADSVERGSKTDQARRLAGTLLRAYQEQVGISGGERPASVNRDWDARLHRGYGGLTHRGRDI